MSQKKDERMGKIPLEGFRFQEELIVAKREIAELYHPVLEDTRVYRTFVTNPPSDIDVTAKAYRDRDEGAALNGGLSQEAYNALNKKKKREYISEHSLSVNDSHQAAELSGKKSYQSVAKSVGEEYAEMFMENVRGAYMKHGDRFLFHRQFFKSKMRKEKFFLLLRQYEEEMLDAFLQDDDYFPELTSLTFVKGPGDRYLFHGITKSVIINS